MTDATSQFTGSIPEYYDRGLGPVIFVPYAQDLVRRATETAGIKDVLELAAGTGIVTRRLRNALPDTALLTITDLNAAMLDIARKKFRAGEHVTFQPADAMTLPFTNAAFDLIVCQFGVMFFPDKVAAFREARRVLKPGGRYVLNVWGPLASNPFSQIALEVGTKLFPANPPQFYRAPFSYADPDRVVADARAGGFADIGVSSVAFQQEVPDWAQFIEGVVRGNPVIAELEAQDPNAADRFADDLAAAYTARFGAAPTRMPLQAFVFVCA